MKKIGVLFGMEDSFPWAFCEEVNRQTGGKDIIAEPVLIDKVEQAVPTDYAVIIDRISQDVPFYRAYLKNAAISGTAVINNPFWWSADEKFFNNSLAIKVGVPVPNTVLLPSKERPTDTSETSFRNMNMPLDWDYMFDKIGFPAYMKPHSGGGWKSVYRVENPEDLWNKLGETGQLVMLLQEEIEFTDYYRCYCLGSKYIHIMPYEPRNPHHLRYATQPQTQGEEQKKLYALMEDYILRLNKALGYDFNTIEFAIRDGIPYAIDFGNPAPDAEITSVGQENFDWIVKHSAMYAIERAKAQKPGQNNLTWGTFVETAVLGENEDILAKKAQGIETKPATPKKPAAKKAAPKKAVAKKTTKK